MPTLNIQTDYGAVGDGSTDDTEAILNAIQDAQPDDTVYVPSGTYLVNKANSPHHQGVILFRASDGVDDVTFRGDGEQTTILLDSGHDPFTQVLRISPDTGNINGLALRDFVIDGNRSNQNTQTDGHGLSIPDEGHADNNDISIRNVRIEDNIGTALASRSGGVTVEDCTALRAAEHGFSAEHPTSANDVEILRCLADSPGQVDSGQYCFDFSGGSGVVEDCVGIDSGGGGAKATTDAANVTFRRVRLLRFDSLGWQTTGTGSVTVMFEDVIIKNGRYVGVRADESTTLIVPSGSDVIASDIFDDDGYQLHENVDIQGNGTLHAANNSGYGLYADSNTTGTIAEFRASGNANGPLNNGGSVSVVSQRSDPIADIPGVPTASEVGAFIESDTVEDPQETYETDFGSATVRGQLDGWSAEWATATSEFTLVDQGTVGDMSLALSADAGARRALRWTAPGEVADVELHALVMVPEFDTDTNDYARLYARGSGISGGESAYFFTIRDGAFAIRAYADGEMNQFWSGGTPTAGQHYLVRFRVEGMDLKLKVWEHGATEPGDWDATVTDSSLSSKGWTGVGAYSNATQYWDAVTIGTGGLGAPSIQSSGDSSGSSAIRSEGGLIQSSGGIVDTV